MRHVLTAFRDHSVLVLGDVMLDEYVTGDCSRISPEAPVPVVAVRSSRTVLGGAANTAANVAALGGRAILIGLVGRDEAGEELGAKARAAGIEFVPLTHDLPTVRKIRVVGQYQQLLRLDYETIRSIDAQGQTQILEAVESHVRGCSIVVISDYAKGLLNGDLYQGVLEIARRCGKRSIVDPRPEHAAFYRGCDYMTPNWKESLGLLDRTERSPEPAAVAETGRLLAERFGSNVLLTLGAKGMTFFDREGRALFEEPAIAREVFDVSGAGDTVVATFALALAAGCDHREAVAIANRAAGVVVGKLGTATVTPDELLQEAEPPRRLLQRGELAVLARSLRAKGKRIVTVNGSFDLLHTGHVHILQEARRQGDVLFVGLNSDASVRANKGDARPFVGQDERAGLLLALRAVDYVHIFDEPVPMPFLEQVQPDVHVNGAEYGADCIEAPTVQAHGGRIHIVERIAGLATSDVAARIAATLAPGASSVHR